MQILKAEVSGYRSLHKVIEFPSCDGSKLDADLRPTALGTYNPDWAVMVGSDGQDKLYFVVETKSSSWWDDLRHKEGAKIKCGEKHFAVLAEGENPAKYIKATSVGDMMKHG